MIPLFGPESPAPAVADEPDVQWCRRCQRPLTDSVSVGYEIGPVCRDRLGIPNPASPATGGRACPCEPIPGQLTLFDLPDVEDAS